MGNADTPCQILFLGIGVKDFHRLIPFKLDELQDVCNAPKHLSVRNVACKGDMAMGGIPPYTCHILS